jgi:hypothetical protein
MTKMLPAVVDSRPPSSLEAWRAMSLGDRLEAVRGIRIFTPDASRYLTRLDGRVRAGGPAASGNAGLLITGPAHIGKHSFVEELARSNPPVPTETRHAHRVIVVPPIARPDPGALTEAIELATEWRYRERLFGGAGPSFQVNRICEALNTRVLVFDRAMFLCNQFSIAAEAVPFLSGIMDAGRVLVVLVGSETLENRIKKTNGLSQRFFVWRLKPFEYDAQWIKAVESYDDKMPFKKGALTADTMPARLFLACWGKMPRFAQLTVEAARNRLRNRSSNETIEMKDFYLAYAELEPDDKKNPFDEEYEAPVLMDLIDRGPQVTSAALTGIDR